MCILPCLTYHTKQLKNLDLFYENIKKSTVNRILNLKKAQMIDLIQYHGISEHDMKKTKNPTKLDENITPQSQMRMIAEKSKKRQQNISQVMKQQGLKYREAVKYIKDNKEAFK